jgi:6-phosphogluconolactonase
VGTLVESALAPTVRVFDNLRSASASLARHLARKARESVRARGVFTWVLAGGSTPQTLYQLLARNYRDSLPWPQVELYFGDERCVGIRHRESNYRAAWETLLSRVPVSRRRIHRMHAELRPLSRAAAQSAREIGPFPFSSRTSPRFDEVLLGVGPDGHTASLFPDAPALREKRRSVVAVRQAGQPPFVPRLTLTLPAIASSREVCFLVAGEEKALAVSRIFHTFPKGTPRFPASLVRSQGPTLWFLDRRASSALPLEYRSGAAGQHRALRGTS